MKKNEIAEQIKLAFNYVDKLFFEISNFIKEIEGTLIEEPEKFFILRPSGYGINYRSSSGLEANNVKLWLLRKFSVAFVADSDTKNNGQTTTKLNEKLKVIYFKFVLDDKNIKEPSIYCGILYNIKKSREESQMDKFEKAMQHIEYRDEKIFNEDKDVNYSDNYISFKGKLFKVHLLDFNDSETINAKIIQPLLKMYREHKS